MTLGEAREKLRTMVEDGADCPCCSQRAKVYKRRLNAGMAASLVKLWRATGRQPGVFWHGPSLPGDTHEISQLSWWGLIVDEPTRRPDGGRTGWWAVTAEGERWLNGWATCYSHAHVYDGRCLRLDGRQLTVQQALGKGFDFRELMDS